MGKLIYSWYANPKTVYVLCTMFVQCAAEYCKNAFCIQIGKFLYVQAQLSSAVLTVLTVWLIFIANENLKKKKKKKNE